MLRSPIHTAPLSIQRFHADKVLPLLQRFAFKPYVAGGCLRDLVAEFPNSKDIDVWFPDETTWRFAVYYAPGELRYTSSNAVAFKDADLGTVDLVRHFHPDPTDLLSKFDFVACCAAVTVNEYIRHPDFERDAFARKLTLNSLPNATAERMNRFLQRGWRIDSATQLKIAMQPPKSYPCA